MINHDKRLVGHVDPDKTEIYLSWRAVKFGFAINDDAINVALHEFAHWLELENRLSGLNQDYLCR